jgi:myo-inositol 2-dehydrogenase/D-chiro-inositol 1-dehydrogenase
MTAVPMRATTVRVGVIGTGVMGTDHALMLGRVVAGASLSAVFDVDGERAAAVAGSVPGTRVLADPIGLIGDDAVDAVLVASSDATHEDFVLAAIAAGKPVLCEKPLAPTVAGCRRIVEAEAATDRRLVSVGFMRRYDPGYAEIKRLLDDGELGRALMLHCVHRNPSSRPGQPRGASIGGSAVHEIDIARWLLGDEIATVSVHTPRPARSGETMGDPLLIVLETGSGVLVDVEVFVNARYGYDVRCELVGEEGTAALDAPAATLVRRGLVEGRGLPADWRPRFAEAYRRELQDWIDGLRGMGGTGGSVTAATAWDGYVATAVAEAGVVALHSGTPQKVVLDKL